MKLRHDDLSSVTIQPYEKMNLVKMSNIFSKMVENDLHLLPSRNSVPGIWKCRWYNDASLSTTLQYHKGEAVWLNTEDPDEFVSTFLNDIIDCIKQDVELNSKYIQISADSDAVFDLCKSVAFSNRKPLYYIGALTATAQLRIALSDTVELPTNDKYWENILASNTVAINTEKINNSLVKQYAEQLSNHIRDYHLSNEFDFDSVDEIFLKNDFSNIKYTNAHTNHAYPRQLSGMDVPQLYIKKTFNGLIIRWFRLWKSGLLEHGGIVDVNNPLAVDSSAYSGEFYKVGLNWPFSNNTAPIYDYTRLSENDFYRKGLSVSNGSNGTTAYNYSSTFDEKFKYTVNITPIASSSVVNMYFPYTNDNAVGIGEITEMTDKSFCFRFKRVSSSSNTYRYYSYYVRGMTVTNVRKY